LVTNILSLPLNYLACDTDSNCVSCKGFGPYTCTKCKDGYYVKSGECQKCAEGCESCTGTANTDCKNCVKGYFRTSEYSACKACDPSCADCDVGPNGFNEECRTCAANYYMTEWSGCQSCGDGKYSPPGATSEAECKGNLSK